jgi:hypothetical protein
MACQETAASMSSAASPHVCPVIRAIRPAQLQVSAAGLVGHELLIGTGQLLGEKCKIFDGTAAEPDRAA